MVSNHESNALTQDDTSYRALLANRRAIIAAAVNTEVVATYWRIGERIVRVAQAGAERAGYGERLLAQLGRALTMEFGRAFSEHNLYHMRQFYLNMPIPNALRQN